MTRSPAPRRGALLRARAAIAAVIGLAAGALGLALVPAGAASASLGSVPAEVTAYVAGGGMVARLNDVYGPNASGTAGIKFDDTTKAGPISRVYEWTGDRLANHPTTHPVQLTNNWVVPIGAGALGESFSEVTGTLPEIPDRPATSGVTLPSASASHALVVESRTRAAVAGTVVRAVPSVAEGSNDASSASTVCGLIQIVASPTDLPEIVIGTTQLLVSCTGCVVARLASRSAVHS